MQVNQKKIIRYWILFSSFSHQWRANAKFAKFNRSSKPAFTRAKLKDFPPLRRGGGGRGTKGEDFSTSRTKASSDYASEWTRDPRRGWLHTN
jgi:hypothetical protein